MPKYLERLPNLRRGDTFGLPLEIVSVDDETQPLDITGRRYTWTGKRSLSLADSEATGENGWRVSAVASGADAVLGKITLIVPSTETGQLLGSYAMDLQESIDGPPDYVRTLLCQAITVYADVTRGLQ